MQQGYLSEIFVSFQGEGSHVGKRHLFVRLSGCHLRCRYCDTPGSLERGRTYKVYDAQTREHTNPIDAQDLRRLLEEWVVAKTPVEAIAITGGEPLLQAEFLVSVLGPTKIEVPVLLETSGTLPKKLAPVLPFIDIVSMDIKPPSNTGEPAFWEEHQAFLRMSASKDLYVKVLVDEATDAAEIEQSVSMVIANAPDAPIFLQPIMSNTGKPLVSAELLDDLYCLMRAQSSQVRVLPQTHRLLGLR